MTWLEIIFWSCLLIIFYSYIGYAILVYLLVSVKKLFYHKRLSALTDNALPTVALVTAAWNEEDFIAQKIQNCLEVDYPRDKLELVIITDGSTDKTVEIIKQYPQIKLLHHPERRGKAAAMNRSVDHCNSEVLVFSDANTFLNKECIRKIAVHYADPKVGGVAGEKKIIMPGQPTTAASGEGLYWKYESFLKKLDSDLYTTVGAAGELFSIRKSLFEAAPEGTIIEDFVQSLRLCEKGYVVKYEPGAFAAETPSASIQDEMKRKVRICAGAFQAMILLKSLFNVFKYPIVSFQFVSHRILRWTICPLALLLLLPTNVAIVSQGSGSFYAITLVCQAIFYLLAGLGWVYALRNRRLKLLFVPFYFLFINLAVFKGFIRFIRKKQTVLWEKASRQRLA